MKIGLMYVSDYYYGATNTYWTYPGWNSSENDYRLALNSNWILLKSNYSSYINEWSISRDSSCSNSAFLIMYQGYVSNSSINIAIPTVIRPVFYLTSSTTYVSGSGTISDPIRIN